MNITSDLIYRACLPALSRVRVPQYGLHMCSMGMFNIDQGHPDFASKVSLECFEEFVFQVQNLRVLFLELV